MGVVLCIALSILNVWVVHLGSGWQARMGGNKFGSSSKTWPLSWGSFWHFSNTGKAENSVIFSRLSTVLGEQASQTREALQYVIQRIRRPGPAESPRLPIFAEGTLRRLFSRRHWKPVFALADPLTSADRKLRRLHRRLDKRQRAATNYQSFVNEQRFATFLLQGAIALGRSERAENDVRLNRLIEVASDRLQNALHVPGNASDLNALELKTILPRKLGYIDVNGVAREGDRRARQG